MGTRILEIDGCRECTHYKSRANHNSEDEYYASCEKLDEERSVRIRNQGFLFNCPLPTLDELTNGFDIYGNNE